MPEVLVMGAGLRGCADVTLATVAQIKSCNVVYHLVSGIEITTALSRWNNRAISLVPLYEEGMLDLEVYDEITETVLTAAATHARVGLVVMGHPSLYVAPTQFLVQRGPARGIDVHVTPGISTIDAILPALGVDIGNTGLQIYDANRLVTYRIHPRQDVPLLIFQAGCFGSGYITRLQDNRPDRLAILVDHLQYSYPADQPVTIYESEMGTGHQARRWVLPLAALRSNAQLVNYNSTLYLPAAQPVAVHAAEFQRSLTDPVRVKDLVEPR